MPSAITDQESLLRAWEHHAKDMPAVHALMDKMLLEETLEHILSAWQETWSGPDFDALLDHAFNRAEQFTDTKQGKPRVSLLIGCPMMGDLRDFPSCSPNFWSHLTEFARVCWGGQPSCTLSLIPIGTPIRAEAIAHFNIKGWHRMLRDAVTLAPVTPALSRLLAVDASLGSDAAVSPNSAIVAMTQRIQLATISFDPDDFTKIPSMALLFRQAGAQPKAWENIVGTIPPHGQIVPPQRLRGAMAVALHQYLEASIAVSLVHRQRMRPGKLEWVDGGTTPHAITLLPRHDGEWLDPVTVSGQWLNTVGVALTNEILKRLMDKFTPNLASLPSQPGGLASPKRVQ